MEKKYVTFFAVLIVASFCRAGEDYFPDYPFYQSFCYHDVKDKVYGNYDPDVMAVSTEVLFGQFAWMRDHGFHALSVDEILAAERGEAPLPENSVLITFDDGLISSYSVVFPMLKLFNYPAVIAPVVAWIENPKKHIVKYASRVLDKHDFMTWSQLREIAQHGLVEIGSHSYDLHRGIRGNPQGNSEPAAVTRRYDPTTGRYETDENYYNRIYEDLKLSADIIEEKVGIRPRTMVWPYGKYNQTTINISKKVGMPVTLVLDHPVNPLGNPARVGRHLVAKNLPLDIFTWGLRNPDWTYPNRMILIDMDDVYNEDLTVTNKNIDMLLDRIREMQVSHVILKAFSDTDRDGVAESLYFPNKHMPMKVDLYNRVSFLLKVRGGVDVLAWLPLLSFKLPENKNPVYVQNNQTATGGERRLRLSPFHPQSREMILEIYEDLGRAADIFGMLFWDDAFLRSDEDASPAALEWYQSEWGLPPNVKAINANPDTAQRWSKLKTRFLIEFTEEIRARTDYFRAPLTIVRAIDTQTLMYPELETDSAQSYQAFLKGYGLVMIDAEPHHKKKRHKFKWIKELTDQARLFDPHFKHTFFHLNAMNSGSPVSGPMMQDRMEYLILQGALGFSYGPDQFTINRPEGVNIRLGMSLREFPYD